MFLIPFACSVNSRGGATPMQAKWVKLDLGALWGRLVMFMGQYTAQVAPLTSPHGLLLQTEGLNPCHHRSTFEISALKT